ncbi:amidase [Paraglaciecola sp. L3A3]|uniref:amidase n=1 Tax=Paraglaciecola sp. L3A3 TaxID=2686358 RepID=UPI00131A91B1|nr:amidase [Paraglaciecola sp. L3A3]
MSELSEVLGAVMISLVHARRLADEETAAVAEYYKDNPLLEGMSLPRVRVPELTIDMPITFEQHIPAKDAELDTPSNIHKALMEQFKQSLDDEDILSKTKSFQASFDKESKLALDKISEMQRSGNTRVTREALLRSIDDAFAKSLKKNTANKEIPFEKTQVVNKSIRHKLSQVALKSNSYPLSLVANATTSSIKESTNPANSVRLQITLREEGLEWATSSQDGKIKNRLQPE